MNSPEKLFQILIFKKRDEAKYKSLVPVEDRIDIGKIYGQVEFLMVHGKELRATRDAQHGFEEHGQRNASTVVKRVYETLFSVGDGHEPDASTDDQLTS